MIAKVLQWVWKNRAWIIPATKYVYEKTPEVIRYIKNKTTKITEKWGQKKK